MWFLSNAYLIFLLPALSFAVILLFGKRLKNGGDMIGIVAVGVSFILACGTAVQWINRAGVGVGEEKLRPSSNRPLFTWFDSGAQKPQFATHIDGLTVMLLFVAPFTSMMVHISSTSYMHGDRRYTYFF